MQRCLKRSSELLIKFQNPFFSFLWISREHKKISKSIKKIYVKIYVVINCLQGQCGRSTRKFSPIIIHRSFSPPSLIIFIDVMKNLLFGGGKITQIIVFDGIRFLNAVWPVSVSFFFSFSEPLTSAKLYWWK